MRDLVTQKKNKRLSAVKCCGWLSGAGTGTGTEITGINEKTQIFRGLTAGKLKMSSKMIGGPYVLLTLTLSWQRSIVRLLMI